MQEGPQAQGGQGCVEGVSGGRVSVCWSLGFDGSRIRVISFLIALTIRTRSFVSLHSVFFPWPTPLSRRHAFGLEYPLSTVLYKTLSCHYEGNIRGSFSCVLWEGERVWTMGESRDV